MQKKTTYHPLEFIQRYYSHSSMDEKRKKKLFMKFCSHNGLPEESFEDMIRITISFINYLKEQEVFKTREVPIVGICGAQGSGKTTFAELLKEIMQTYNGLNVVSFSLDDFYLSKAQRVILGKEIHPLLITRGVPGTHEVSLGIQKILELRRTNKNSKTLIPVFSKALDDRLPENEWVKFSGKPDVIIFEGWCVGAGRINPNELEHPINELERKHDKKAIYRNFINEQLESDYKNWFSLIDYQVFMEIPSFEKVREWRWLQEQKLIATLKEQKHKKNKHFTMSEKQLDFFISHFERITKHCQKTMPDKADAVFGIGEDHQFLTISIDE
jgi:D-glycerate 3-kinase